MFHVREEEEGEEEEEEDEVGEEKKRHANARGHAGQLLGALKCICLLNLRSIQK